jgi:hypothetical protein
VDNNYPKFSYSQIVNWGETERSKPSVLITLLRTQKDEVKEKAM